VSPPPTHTPTVRALTHEAVRAPPRDAFFVTVIIKAPVIQVISIVLAGFIIALEFPIPHLKGTKLHRTIPLRIPLLLVQAFLAVLFYQVGSCFMSMPRSLIHHRLCYHQGTNGAIWSLIAAGCYARSVMLGEEMNEVKEDRSRRGGQV
jgi:hypothetical protein